MRFITSIFGDRYFGMLPPLLYSISKTNPRAGITVLWEEMDEKKILLLKSVYPNIDFRKTHFKFSEDTIKRISSKTLLWEEALLSQNFTEEILVLLDVDTLVLKNLTFLPEIQDRDYDIIFTIKNEHYPLNTGVMVSKNNSRARAFFSSWREATMKILGDSALFNQSTSRAYPYGGADQMALYNIIHFSRNIDRYSLNINGEKTIFKSIPCSILNETNSTVIQPTTHIIHFKGGWQPILLNGYCFTKKRPRERSREMYLYYLRNFRDSTRYILQKGRKEYIKNDLGITIPFYINKETLKEREWLYPFYYLSAKIREYLDASIRIISRLKRTLKTSLFKRGA